MRKIYSFLLLTMMLLGAVTAKAVTITKQGGWFEAAYVEWTPESGATYEVYVKGSGDWEKLDAELLRNYGSYMRADAVGLKAGTYQLKVVSSASGEATTGDITVQAHDRSGFAHVGMTGGIGAYKNDGTLKDGAKVLYVTANNAKTISCEMQTDDKGGKETCTGLQGIVAKLEKKVSNRTPLAIRIIGTIKDSDMDAFGSSAEGLQVKGSSSSYNANVTIEGIGEDAAIHGFGILCRAISSAEFRNFAVIACMDDCLSLDTDNKHVWIHNMDFFYGKTGGDADQAKGDGTVDIKGKSSHVTVSYNHFFDSGKCSLGGMKSETTDCWMTYHHNWFDHSDSRHPRIRTAFYHVYNNYFDGNAKYGVGCTSGGSAFVESNYFRNCKYPMLSSKQGTDAEGDGTFSGEAGGVIKAFNNKIINPKKVQWYNASDADAVAEGKWDAVKVESRDEDVTAVAYSGGTAYNTAATTAAISAVPADAIDPAEDVALICRGEKEGRIGAGRMNGGDIKWTFLYTAQDANYGVIADLKSAVVNYKSTLVGFADGTTIKNGGATERIDAGDGKGYTQKIGDDTPAPSWGADVAETDEAQKVFIGGDNGDYYWFNEANDTQTKAYNTAGTITWDENSSYGTDKQATSSDGTFTGEYTGAIALKSSTGYATFYCPDGITTAVFKIVRSGSASGEIQASADGSSFSKVGTYSYKAKGTNTVSQALPDDMKYVRILNTSGGTLYIHGVKIMTAGEEEPDNRLTCDIAATPTSVSVNIGATANVSYTSSSTGTVTYTSSNTKVATVSASGEITGVAEGTATITLNQVADADYKAGKATVSVTVTDPRAASTFALTSNATVSIKETETSQIATSGAAGTVTYSSNKTSVATVDASGLITAVATGTAIITVTDPGSTSTKGKSLTVNVTVTKDLTGKEICHFTNNTTSLDYVQKVAGNYSNGKGSVTYGDETYNNCLKMESSTNLTITPPSACKVTLVFGGSPAAAGQKFKLDGTSTTLDANGEYSFDATAGTTYTVTKESGINLFLIIFDATTSGGGEQGGGEQGGGDTGNDTSADALNYPTSLDGVNIKGTSVLSEDKKTIQLKNSYSSKDSDNNPVYGNGILLKKNGGFKAGDVITVSGTIAVETTDEKYATKIATTVSLVTVDPTDVSKTTVVNKFEPLANTKESVQPTDQSFSLTEDYDVLWLIRDGGTTVTVTKIATGAEQGGGQQGGGEQGGETSDKLIDYQHAAAVTPGVTISGTTAMGSANIHTNTDSANGIKLSNGYTTNNAINDNYIKLQVEGGFKAGDVVTIAGFFNNSDDNKESAAALFVPKEDGTAEVLWTTEKFINGRLDSKDPVPQTYTLEKDCEVLYIGRAGNTSTYIYTLTVERPTADGIDAITSAKPAKAVMYDLQGRRIIKAAKGQMYILNGKKYLQK